MLFPEQKERELRFKLALRIGLPIFALTVTLLFSILSEYFTTIPHSLAILALVVLGIMIYFIFFLIYRGEDERITDLTTGTFKPEYLVKLFERKIKKDIYSIVLISVDNLDDINRRYGSKNGDKILFEVAHLVGTFFESKGLSKFPIGHYRGGDFLLGFDGSKIEYKSMLDLFSLKSDSLVLGDIEVQMSTSIVDSSLSENLNHLFDRLYEIQKESLEERRENEENEINPSSLESEVIEAISNRSFSCMFQDVKNSSLGHMLETSVKLVSQDKHMIHQKKFMPIISRLGLLREFETLMVGELVRVCSADESNDIYAISITPSILRHHGFFESVQQLFNDNHKVRGRICFILEESEYFHRVARYNEVLQSFRRMGILITLDRLGVLNTTLQYLKVLDVDMVRFDSSLGKHINIKSSRSILKGLQLMCKDMGYKTWIKMIENEEGAKHIEKIGIDYKQGNYYGKMFNQGS